MKEKLKHIFKHLTGLTVNKKLPLGCNPYDDLKHRFKEYSFDLFFDIGANSGQSVSKIKESFPDSSIWSFEPVKNTYDALVENTQNQNIKCFQIGFGAQNSEVEIYFDKNTRTSTTASILESSNRNDISVEIETIKIVTLDSFCAKNEIEKIDYVKIDTEGYDLEVLKGADRLLKEGKISFVETEVGMNPENTFHVKFEDMKLYMEKLDYRLFGIYGQVQEWPTNKPILRRTNALFISKDLYGDNISMGK